MAQRAALHILKSGVVLDRAQFVGQSAIEMSDTITAITKEGRPLLVVDDATKFFTIGNLMKMVKDQNGQYNLIAEGLDANGKFIGGGQPVEEGKVVGVGNMVNYQFMPVPLGWSIGANMSLGPNKIKRKVVNVQGDGTAFWLSPTTYKSIWLAASRFWANMPKHALSVSVMTENGRKSAYFLGERVDIGGNTIRRYELEQVAKHRGWEFPQAAAA